MNAESSFSIIGVGFCLILLAFTSAVDAALSAISRHRLSLLKDEQTSRAQIITRLLADPYRLKSTLALLNAAALIGATVCTLLLVQQAALSWQVGALALLLLLVVLFSIALPKALVTRNPAKAAERLARPATLLSSLLWPIVAVLDWLTNPLIRWLSGQRSPHLPLVTEEELMLIVNVGEEE